MPGHEGATSGRVIAISLINGDYVSAGTVAGWRHQMHDTLSRFDLNLLVALNALLEERSVTRAATRLGLTQPALSASLSRLRVLFSDELMVRRGNQYEFTSLAERLSEQVPAALDTVGRIFAHDVVFDAARSRREFVLFGSDYAFATLGAAATKIASQEAPRITFRFKPHSPDTTENAVDVLRTADGIILPRGCLRDLPRIDVIEDSWVCVVSETNTRVGDTLTLDHLRQLPWVAAYQSRSTYSPPIKQLQMMGIEPRFEVIVEEFLTLPFLVRGTDRIAVMQAGLLPLFESLPGVRFLACPFEPVKLVDALWWHPMHGRDPGHVWMRDLFTRAGTL